MGRIIHDPECICNCECCLGECVPTAYIVTFSGVVNRAPPVCGVCPDWNGVPFLMRQVARGTACIWEGLGPFPCLGSGLDLIIGCPWAGPLGDGIRAGIELEVHVNGLFMGHFFYLVANPNDLFNCHNLTFPVAFVESGTPAANRICDFTGSSVIISIP